MGASGMDVLPLRCNPVGCEAETCTARGGEYELSSAIACTLNTAQEALVSALTHAVGRELAGVQQCLAAEFTRSLDVILQGLQPADIPRLLADCDHYRAEAERLSGEKEAALADAAQAAEMAEENIGQLRAEVVDLTADCNRLRVEATVAAADVATLTAEREQLLGEAEELRSRNARVAVDAQTPLEACAAPAVHEAVTGSALVSLRAAELSAHMKRAEQELKVAEEVAALLKAAEEDVLRVAAESAEMCREEEEEALAEIAHAADNAILGLRPAGQGRAAKGGEDSPYSRAAIAKQGLQNNGTGVPPKVPALRSGRYSREQLRALVSRSSNAQDQAAGDGRMWVVVGGEDKGGILVRSGQELASNAYEYRLARGTRIEQVEISGNRLHYRRIQGDGPDWGWVNLSVSGKRLVQPEDEEDSD